MDLLLHLIEKEELDITTVSLTAVTDQYLEHIAQLEHVSAEALADFLVVAAKLLLIKSRALLPAPPPLEADLGKSSSDGCGSTRNSRKRHCYCGKERRPASAATCELPLYLTWRESWT